MPREPEVGVAGGGGCGAETGLGMGLVGAGLGGDGLLVAAGEEPGGWWVAELSPIVYRAARGQDSYPGHFYDHALCLQSFWLSSYYECHVFSFGIIFCKIIASVFLVNKLYAPCGRCVL